MPTKARVFEWQEKKGFLIRCFIPRNLVDTVWYDYARSQKRYNSVLNEWDLCKELEPSARPELHPHGTYDEDDDDDDDNFPRFVHIDEQPHTQGSDEQPPAPGEATQRNIVQVYGPRESFKENRIAALALRPILHVLYLRYGFNFDGTVPIPPSQLDINKAVAILTEGKNQTIGNQHTVNAICAFVHCFIENIEVLPALHDISSTNLNEFMAGCNKQFTFNKYESFFTITSSSSPEYILCTPPCPSLLVQLLRDSEATDLARAALSFASNGIPFDWIPADNRTRPVFLLSTSSSPFGLGLRPPSFQASYVDYKGYKDQRKKLLSDVAIVREALKFGGIVWRLTVEAYREAHEGRIDFAEILQAPLEKVSLTERDVGIIVGLYRVWSRK